MKKTNLCLCIKDDKILLAMKKRGFGAGKWNGYGGKVQGGETPQSAAIREIKEESELIIEEKNLKQVALLNFYFEEEPFFECHVYLIDSWQGEPIETEEMRPKWYPISQIPYQEMWAADAKWIPIVLSGEKIEAKINFSADGSVVKDFSYKPAKFTELN